MRILGLDPATCTGWAQLDIDGDGNTSLTDFGSIKAQANLNLPQKLNFYSLEVKRLMERTQPDYCAIEDLILGQSGVKTLVYLGRISGVIIHSSFEILKDKVELYYPNIWKANSLKNLTGNAPKWKIQLEVCREFSSSLDCDASQWQYQFDFYNKIIQQKQDNNDLLKKEIDNLNKKLNRKRNPLSENDKKETEKLLKDYKSKYESGKKELKDCKKTRDKNMEKLGTDIYSQTGITYDIADAVCIAMCLKNEFGDINNG